MDSAMLISIFILYFIFVTVIGVWISFLLIRQDKEVRRMKRVIDDQKSQAQTNTKQLEEFYQQKQQFMNDKNNEIAAFEAKLQDERNISALTLKNSEMARAQLRQQQEEIVKLKSEIQSLNGQLQGANENRLIEVQNEKQKWSDTIQAKESKLQKLGSTASSMESVMDTLGLISKEMHHRLDEHHSKMQLLDEKAQENLELIGQLES